MGTTTGYRVTGKYITVKTMTQDGPRIVGLHEGAPLPADVSKESIDHHLAVNLIEPFEYNDGKPAAKAKAEAEEDEAPGKAGGQSPTQPHTGASSSTPATGGSVSKPAGGKST
jgi:hypothetical protein